jgi:RNA polymerase sigma factor (sigma-70 family)
LIQKEIPEMATASETRVWYEQRLAERDWDAIVNRDERRFLAMARKLSLSWPILTEADCQDIAQNTAIQIFRNHRTFDPKRASYETWSTHVFRNVFFDFLRKLRPSQEGLMEPPAQWDGTLAEWIDRKAAHLTFEGQMIARLDVEKALEQLAPDELELLVMARYEGRSAEELATLFGVGYEAMKRRITRVQKKLRDLLEQAPAGAEGKETAS